LNFQHSRSINVVDELPIWEIDDFRDINLKTLLNDAKMQKLKYDDLIKQLKN
jgi:hypothetical protein